MNLNPCTPVEAQYALAMVQDRSFQSGARVAQFFVAEAALVDTVRTTWPIPYTDRGITNAVFVRSVTRARIVMADLYRRKVMERTHIGTNEHDPSEARFLHPVHWDVKFIFDREELGERLTRFSASGTRALIDPAARGHRTRAPMGSAVAISALNDALARASMDARGGRGTARASMDARAGGAPVPSTSIDEIYLSRGSEGAMQSAENSTGDPRGDALLEAIRRGGGGRRIWGAPEVRIRYLAQECNGRLPELVRIADHPQGPSLTTTMVAILESTFRSEPAPGARDVSRSAQLLRDLEAAERAGDLESAEALRQSLATMEP